MQLINRAGHSVFLDVPVAALASRMMKTTLALRPLFANTKPADIESQMSRFRAERLPYYSKAKFTFKGESIGAEEILGVIRTENQK